MSVNMSNIQNILELEKLINTQDFPKAKNGPNEIYLTKGSEWEIDNITCEDLFRFLTRVNPTFFWLGAMYINDLLYFLNCEGKLREVKQ